MDPVLSFFGILIELDFDLVQKQNVAKIQPSQTHPWLNNSQND